MPLASPPFPSGNKDPARSGCWSAAVSPDGAAGAKLMQRPWGLEEIKTKRKTLNTDAENFGLFVLFHSPERLAHRAPRILASPGDGVWGSVCAPAA